MRVDEEADAEGPQLLISAVQQVAEEEEEAQQQQQQAAMAAEPPPQQAELETRAANRVAPAAAASK